MKKLFSVLLVVAMLMSLFSTSALAITVESDVYVYTQDFTNATSSDFDGAGEGSASLVESGSGKWLSIVPTSKATQTTSQNAGAKVFINNTNMVVGKNYKIYADVTFTPQSADAGTVTSGKVNMKVLNGTGSTQHSVTWNSVVPVGETVTLSTPVFTYTEELKTNTANLRVDFNAYRSSATDSDVVTVDNVRVVELVDQSMFKKARNITFDEIQADYTLDDADCIAEGVSGWNPRKATIVASPSGSGNSLKIDPNNKAFRYTLRGFFDAEDEGKEYRISMKIYPTAIDATGIQIGVKPYYDGVTNNGWNGDKEYSIGNAGSTADMIVNTWNTITFTATIGTHGGHVQDGIAFRQNTAAGIIPFYVDDIVIEEVRPMFEKARNVTFDDKGVGYQLNADEYDKNNGGVPTIVSSPSYSGNSLKLTPGAHDHRYTLKGFFDEADRGKKFKITMKVYPTKASSKGIKIGVKAFYTNAYDNGWVADSKYYTVGEAGSGRDMIVNTWNTITFNATIGEYGGNLHNSIAFIQKDTTELINEFYVDDIVIEEVIDRPLFKGARNVTFDDKDAGYELKADEYDKNGGSAPTIVSSPSYSGNSLRIPQTATNVRYTLKGFFDEEDVDKKFKITMKIYPTGSDAKGIRINSKAYYENVTNNGWNGEDYYSVGEAGSGRDMIVNTWNTISFTAKISTFNGYVHDSIAFYQNQASTAYEFYVDDIVIEEVIDKPLFKGARNVTFDDKDAGYELKADEYDKNGNNVPSIVASPGGKAGNSLKINPDKHDVRYTLKDFFDAADKGKKFKISMKVYPTKASSTGIRIGVKAFYADAANNGWTGDKHYTVGEAGSGRDMIVNTWNTITFDATIADHNGNLHNSIAFTQSGSSEFIDVFYVDDIVIEEVIVVETPLFKGARNVTFDDKDAGYELKADEYDKNGGSAPTIVSSPSYSGNSLRIPQNATNVRYTLKGFFDEEDVDKKFKITMKIYPTGSDATGITIGSKAFYANVTNNGWNGAKEYSVGEAGSGRDMIVNTWNTISFTATISTYNGYVHDSIAFYQSKASKAYEFYVDDIVIEEVIETPLFKGARNVTFDDKDAGYELSAEEYQNNGTSSGKPIIVSSPSYSGNSLKLTPGGHDHRYTLIGFFGEEDVGKDYKITMKVYPTMASSTGIRIGVKAYYNNVGNSGWTDGNGKFYTVGEQGSAADMIVNTWNTITFTAKIGKYNGNLQNSIAFVQNNSQTVIKEFYVDDIVIEETGSYFRDLASDTAVTKSFEEENLALTNLDVKSGGASGFGTISITDDTARTGTKSLKIAGRSVVLTRYKLLDAFKGAKKGDMYRVGAYVKVAGDNSDGARVSLAVMSDESYSDMYYSYAIANATDWTRIEFIYIVDEDSKGNLMDEIAIGQEGHSGSAVDTIYVDDIIVEPVTQNSISDVVINISEGEWSVCVPVKYSVEENIFDGVDNPFMFVVATHSDNGAIKADVASYDESKTEYIYYIKGLASELVDSVRLFKWNGDNLYPLSAPVSLDIYSPVDPIPLMVFESEDFPDDDVDMSWDDLIN